jgi:hypothetical protein
MSRILLCIISLVFFLATVQCQENYFDIVNYHDNDTFLYKWDCSPLNLPFVKSKIPHKLIFSNFRIRYFVDSLLRDSKDVFLGEIAFKAELRSLLFLVINKTDTIDYSQNVNLSIYLVNFGENCKLLSSALIGRYISTFDGFSYSGLDTELHFHKNRIDIKEVTDNHPTDMIVRFKVNKNTFKKTYSYCIKIDKFGSLLQIK